ncbi:MAG: hypothetical protein AAF677_14200 [Pseudomonadota bacterium]
MTTTVRPAARLLTVALLIGATAMPAIAIANEGISFHERKAQRAALQAAFDEARAERANDGPTLVERLFGIGGDAMTAEGEGNATARSNDDRG